MKKKTASSNESRKYGSRENPVPQEHWEMKTGLSKGNNSNPYDTYFARPPSEWPQPHKKINKCDC